LGDEKDIEAGRPHSNLSRLIGSYAHLSGNEDPLLHSHQTSSADGGEETIKVLAHKDLDQKGIEYLKKIDGRFARKVCNVITHRVLAQYATVFENIGSMKRGDETWKGFRDYSRGLKINANYSRLIKQTSLTESLNYDEDGIWKSIRGTCELKLNLDSKSRESLSKMMPLFALNMNFDPCIDPKSASDKGVIKSFNREKGLQPKFAEFTENSMICFDENREQIGEYFWALNPELIDANKYNPLKYEGSFGGNAKRWMRTKFRYPATPDQNEFQVIGDRSFQIPEFVARKFCLVLAYKKHSLEESIAKRSISMSTHSDFEPEEIEFVNVPANDDAAHRAKDPLEQSTVEEVVIHGHHKQHDVTRETITQAN